jgi:hypothetical protein
MYLTNVPNKLECYITLERKGLPRTNTLAYSLVSYEGKMAGNTVADEQE